MNDATCKTCKFFKPVFAGYVLGDCRRRSPSIQTTKSYLGGNDHYPAWPQTKDTDWCGEWEFSYREISSNETPSPV